MEEGVCSLDQVSYLVCIHPKVLDEADRMLDLGFEPAIRAIISKTSKSKLHFSQEDTRIIVHKCLHQVTSRKCQVTQKPVDLVISMFCYKYLCVP
jgi:superfamily II DNA/RNA helicase